MTARNKPSQQQELGVCARCDQPATVAITDAPGNVRCAVHAAVVFGPETVARLTAENQRLTLRAEAAEKVVEAGRNVLARYDSEYEFPEALDVLDAEITAYDQAVQQPQP